MTKKCSVSILIVMLIVFVGTMNSGATELLREDFNDGFYNDGNPVMWEIDWSHTGNPTGDPTQKDYSLPETICDVDGCYLEGYTTRDAGYNKNAALLYTYNPTTVGSWQFDSRLKSTGDDQYNVFLLNSDHIHWDGNGYYVSHSKTSGIRFLKKIGTNFTELIASNTFYGQDDIWHTIKLERNVYGEWKLFVDGSLIGAVFDNELTYLPYIEIGRYGNTDNIIVTDAKTPSEALADLISYIDSSVEQGTLIPEGPGNSARKRLNALKNMIENAIALIDGGDIAGACDQLQSIYDKVDGLKSPPDFISGGATSTVASIVLEVMDTLGCE